MPDVLIGTTNPCSGGLAIIENLARHFDQPLIILHIPQDESGGNVPYLADQIRRPCPVRHRPYGPVPGSGALPARDHEHEPRPRHRVGGVQAGRSTSRHRRRAGTSPTSASSWPSFWGATDPSRWPRPTATVSQHGSPPGKSGVPGEKVRLLWIQNRIQFRHPLEKMLRGAVRGRHRPSTSSTTSTGTRSIPTIPSRHGETGDLDPLQRHDRNEGRAPEEARPPVPRPRRRQPLQLGLPPGDRRARPHRGGAPGAGSPSSTSRWTAWTIGSSPRGSSAPGSRPSSRCWREEPSTW